MELGCRSDVTSRGREGRGNAGRLRKALGLLAIVQLLGVLVLPNMASAAGKQHPPRGVFGPAAQPSFIEAAGMAVDQSTGDLYVIEFEEVAAAEFKGVLSRYHEDGTPANFSALTSTNKIDGHAGEADATPQGEILATFGRLPSALEVQVAVDNSGGATDGNIYVTNGGNAVVDIFKPTGEFAGQIEKFKEGPTAGGSEAGLVETCGVAVDPAGNIYVGTFQGEVHKFSSAGVSVANYTFASSCQIAAGAGPTAGFIFAAHFEGSVGKIDSEGAEEGTEKFEFGASVTTLSVDPATGHVFTAALEEIKEYDASGPSSATEVTGTPVPSLPRGVAANGAAERLYVTRSGNPTVEVYALTTPGGLPAVTEVKPNKGPASGGQTVIITGTNFIGATEVKFGATAAKTFSVESSTEIEAETEAEAPGTVHVTVTNAEGTSTTSAADEYTFVNKPAVTKVEPTKGPAEGGNTIKITGTDLGEATKVEFGSTVVAAPFVKDEAALLEVNAPAHAAGAVHVTVTTAGGTSTTSAADEYTFVNKPEVTKVEPTKGPASGGNTIKITGTDLGEATKVEFGSTVVAAPFVKDEATLIEVAAPAHAAAPVDVTVTTAGGTSGIVAGDKYTYVAAPSITKVSPTEGPVAGGNDVEISGVNLASAEAIHFGTSEVKPPFKSNSGTKIVVTAPGHPAGTVDVTVTTAGGTSATNANDKYTFVEGPTISEVKPNKGPTEGGTKVTVKGTDLTGATFKFGANGATEVAVNGGGTEATMKAPAGAAGTVDVTATTKGGTSAANESDKYTYVAPLTFSVATAGTGTGSVTCNGGACAAAYPFGASVALAAAPGSESTFDGFSGGGCSSTSCTLTIEANTSVTATFTKNAPPPPQCKVPKVKGLSLARAKSAITKAHCKVGPIHKPKARKGKKLGPLVVKSSSPAAGAVRSSGTKVSLTLGPKPKKRH